MNDLDFSFEETPWEAFLGKITPGGPVSAAAVLTLLEGEEEEALEDAFRDLEELNAVLDLSDLPKAGGKGEAALRLRQEAQFVRGGMKLWDLEAGDPLRLYLEEVAGTPAFGDEALLAQAAAEGDENARNMLTNLGLSRVVELAAEQTGYGVLLLDLIQEGSLGLWQAVCGYEGGDYADLRDRAIRFAMAKAILMQARNSGVGEKMRAAMEDYRQVDERLLGDLGRNPTLEEIAVELHMNVEEAAAVGKMLADAQSLARAKKQPEPEEEAEEEDQAVEDTAQFQMRQRILDLLSGLSQQDAKLLTLRFGLEGGKPLSPEEAGRKLGLTPGEVVQREAAALALLRTGN